ncbi:MAG TPA: PA0069 family radical SAM protein [Burkholderiales bacterium]
MLPWEERERPVRPRAEEEPVVVQRDHAPFKGRGANIAPQVRFETLRREAVDDGWNEALAAEEERPPPKTTVTVQKAKSIISSNDSPDIGFSLSMNPYYGCEHGCIYCYARPSYAYWGLSPGIDFETKLFAKGNAAELLVKELSKSSYKCQPIAIGMNTDCYQPIERDWRITRALLEVCAEFNQPITIVTKSALVERDIDILGAMAEKGQAKVLISCASLDGDLVRKLEPRAAAPHKRIETIRKLSEAGIPTGLMVAPLIPMLNDRDIEAVLEGAWEAGAREAAYTLVRLPHELREIFKDWLARYFPMRAEHVMSIIRQSRGGRENDPEFGSRMTGQGVFAELIETRFRKACEKHGYNQREYADRNTGLFAVPERLRPRAEPPPQMSLF